MAEIKRSRTGSVRSSQKFPSDERYALVSQAKRAAVSVPANIAEGFGRISQKDREHFYTMARGSVYELDTHIQIARELGFISKEEHAILLGLIGDVTKLLGAFIRTHKSRNPNL